MTRTQPHITVPDIPDGFTVRYRHRRYFRLASRKRRDVLVDPRGGETIATVHDADGNEVASGESTCLDADTFCKATGRAIALRRALADLQHRQGTDRRDR